MTARPSKLFPERTAARSPRGRKSLGKCEFAAQAGATEEVALTWRWNHREDPEAMFRGLLVRATVS